VLRSVAKMHENALFKIAICCTGLTNLNCLYDFSVLRELFARISRVLQSERRRKCVI